ncbi:hypothetical protein O1M54_07520 [Streptomyces diastatochromogenes]|nr:hypothetical protein [Streptomyces diastatochromogenes]
MLRGHRREIVEAAGRYARTGPDLTELADADVAWWRLIVEGSGNVAYLLAFNSLVGGTLPVADVPDDLRAAELSTSKHISGWRRTSRHARPRRPNGWRASCCPQRARDAAEGGALT